MINCVTYRTNNTTSSTNSYHYISIGKVGDLWFECDDIKLTKIEFNNFYNSNTVYMLFYKRSTRWKHFKKGIGLVPMDADCWVIWWEGIEISSWTPPCMHCLLSLTFVTFLFFDLCLVLLLLSLDIDPVLFVLDLHMKYTVEVVPLHMCIVWFVIVW